MRVLLNVINPSKTTTCQGWKRNCAELLLLLITRGKFGFSHRKKVYPHMHVTPISKEARECHPYIKGPRKMKFPDRALDSMLFPNMENQVSVWICHQDTYYPTRNNCLRHNETLNTKKQRKEHPVSDFKIKSKQWDE